MTGEDVRLGKYKHFKGNLYEVIGVARNSETLEKLVIYRALYDSEEFGEKALWARPLALFLARKRVNGKEVPAFEFIGENK